MKRIITAVLATLATIPALFVFGGSAQAADNPGLSITDICQVVKVQGQREGFDKVSCEAGTFSRTSQNLIPEGKRERHVRLQITTDNLLFAETVEVETKANRNARPNALTMSAAAAIPSSCYTTMCDVTMSRKIELKHLFGAGPNCAWMKFVQRYKVYYPWRVLVDVRSPSVTSGSFFPCNQDSRTSWINRDNLPYWAESGASIHWKVGVPTPWGTVGIREFNPSIGLYFNGSYQTSWQ